MSDTIKNCLTLNIKREYFLEILEGKKTEEFRKVSKHYKSRIDGKDIETLLLKNGYSKNADWLLVNVEKIYKRRRKVKLYGDKPTLVYVIKLGDVIDSFVADNDSTEEQGKNYGRGQHPNSRKNLILGAWQEGESGNPDGKKKGTKDRAKVLNSFLHLKVKVPNPLDANGDKTFVDLPEIIEMTVYEQTAMALIGRALSGDVRAFKEIQDTLHGKHINRRSQLIDENEDKSSELDEAYIDDLERIYGKDKED